MEVMKKYIGVVKVIHVTMAGCWFEFKSKYSDDKALIDKWFELYPDSEKIFFENNSNLNIFFEEFEDFTPITEEEKKEQKRIEKILEEMRNKPIK